MTTQPPIRGIGHSVRRKEDDRFIRGAVSAGARVLAGGAPLEGPGWFYPATVLLADDAGPEAALAGCFGPVALVRGVADPDEAVAAANASPYGLAAGIFTENLGTAMKFARAVDSGNLHINWGPQWRADLMPYGGLKESGFGKEGPKYAVAEMTELKTAVIHGV